MIFMFPGQGSQFVGMGKALYDNFLVAREVFEEVDDVLGFSLSEIVFKGPEEVLLATENAQPAILATSIAAFRVFLRESKLEISDFASYVCGHSLGEYSALCAAGSLSLADAIGLVRFRGLAMKEASKNINGGMVAVIKSNLETIRDILDEVGGFCEVANDNSDDQIVISGSIEALEKFIEIAKIKGVPRLIKLNVSAPFHSSLMKEVCLQMQNALEKINFCFPKVPLIANVTANPVQDLNLLKKYLVMQVASPVRWRESIIFAKENGINNFVEFGPSKVLTNLVKKIHTAAQVYNVHEPGDLHELIDIFTSA